MTMRVADYIARSLESLGVRDVFLLAGGGMMHLLDAVGRRRKLKLICGHHEQACALAAEGYAKKTGRLGVCMVTSGPGATNTVTGVVECWQDSAPVLFLSGQSKLSQTVRGSGIRGLRQFGTFEADILPIVRPVTKFAAFLEDPAEARHYLEKAVSIALSGRPGPVFLDIPVDVQGARIEPDALKGWTGPSASKKAPADRVLDGVLDRLRRARRPLILAGHGIRVAGSAKPFEALLRRLNVPAVTTQLAADLLGYEHPLFVGHPGVKGDRPGNFAIQTADVLLTLGASLHVLTTGYELDRFAPEAYKIQVDLDPAVLRRERVGVDQKIECDVATFVDRMSRRLEARPGPRATWAETGNWHRRCRIWKRDLCVREEIRPRRGSEISYYDLADALSDSCRGGEVVVTDSGISYYVVAQAFRFKREQRLLSSGAMGAMGHALPLAIGAAAADPRSKIVCVTGDGAIQTNIQELATAAHHRMDIALFVVNNGGYLSIRNTQKNYFDGFLVGSDRKSGVSLPRLDRIAEAYGLPYRAVRDARGLASAVGRALEARGPVLCEVFAANDQEVIPAVVSARRADGTMESKPLHDMYPFLSPETLKRHLSGDREFRLV